MATNQEVTIHHVESVIKTTYQKPNIQRSWIELLVRCSDGSTIEITLFAKDMKAFEAIQRSMMVGGIAK